MLKGLIPYQASHPTPHYQRLIIGQTVSFKSLANNMYVSADNGGASPLIANKSVVGVSEKFKIVDAGNGCIAILALINNKYVTADKSSLKPLIASSETIGTNEKFSEADGGNGNISLKANANNMYVNVDNTGNSPLIAKLTTVGLWRTFLIDQY